MSAYKTTDLYLAAYFKTAGVSFLGAEINDTQKVSFIFSRVDGIQDLKKGYFKKSSKVCALEYAENIKALKALIHDLRRSVH